MLDRPYSLEQTVHIDQPLILISQIQRSGGSLLTQLFDHHPQVYTLPTELYCTKNKWLKHEDINTFHKFKLRHNNHLQRYIFQGFDKGRSKLKDRIHFDFNFGLQENITQQFEANSVRESLNRFFTSFFNSWTNFRNMRGDKKFVLAFAPRTIQDIWELSPVNSFYSAYPDGFILSIVREPKNWYSSAEKHSSFYSSPEKAFDLYNSCLEASMNVKMKKSEQTMLISFEDLITNTESVMRMISNKTGIEYSPNLLQPTFNSYPTKSNSSHERVFKVNESVLNREPEKQIDDVQSCQKAKNYMRVLNISFTLLLNFLSPTIFL